jgi:hypothetical protein
MAERWEAFARGEWEESLRLLEAGRADLEVHGQPEVRVTVADGPQHRCGTRYLGSTELWTFSTP